DDQVAGERHLEGRREGERVGGEDDRAGQLFEPVDDLQEAGPELRALLGGEAGEDVDVDPTGDGAAGRPYEDRARRLVCQAEDGRAEVLHHRLVEEVQRRAVEGEDGEAAGVRLDPDDRLAIAHARNLTPPRAGHGTRWTSKRFVPSSWSGRPARMPI